jgi:hypothetical protein
MTTAPPLSLTLPVLAVPEASPASLIVILIDGEYNTHIPEFATTL